jgi:nucleoid DNA-binding protein
MLTAELIVAISDRLGFSEQQTRQIIDVAFNTIEDSLKSGEQVRLTGFGIFEVRERGERQGYHPQTGAEILFPASKRPVFRPSGPLRAAVAMASTELGGESAQSQTTQVEVKKWKPEPSVDDTEKPSSTVQVAKRPRKRQAEPPSESSTGLTTQKPKKPTK